MAVKGLLLLFQPWKNWTQNSSTSKKQWEQRSSPSRQLFTALQQRWRNYNVSKKLTTKQRHHIVPAKRSQGTARTPAILVEVWSWQTLTWHSEHRTDDPPAAIHVPTMLQTYITDRTLLLAVYTLSDLWTLQFTPLVHKDYKFFGQKLTHE